MSKKSCSVDMALCPECIQHVRYCAARVEVDCPFCETRFSPEGLTGTKANAGSIPRGLQKGMMAISFAGVTMLGAGCVGETVQPLYGVPVPPNQEEPYEEEDAGVDADTGGQDAEVEDDATDDAEE